MEKKLSHEQGSAGTQPIPARPERTPWPPRGGLKESRVASGCRIFRVGAVNFRSYLDAISRSGARRDSSRSGRRLSAREDNARLGRRRRRSWLAGEGNEKRGVGTRRGGRGGSSGGGEAGERSRVASVERNRKETRYTL